MPPASAPYTNALPSIPLQAAAPLAYTSLLGAPSQRVAPSTHHPLANAPQVSETLPLPPVTDPAVRYPKRRKAPVPVAPSAPVSKPVEPPKDTPKELFLTPSYADMISKEFRFFDSVDVSSDTGLPMNISKYQQLKMRNRQVSIEVDYKCASTLLRLHRYIPMVDYARDESDSIFDLRNVAEFGHNTDPKFTDPEETYILRRHRGRYSKRLGTPASWTRPGDIVSFPVQDLVSTRSGETLAASVALHAATAPSVEPEGMSAAPLQTLENDLRRSLSSSTTHSPAVARDVPITNAALPPLDAPIANAALPPLDPPADPDPLAALLMHALALCEPDTHAAAYAYLQRCYRFRGWPPADAADDGAGMTEARAALRACVVGFRAAHGAAGAAAAVAAGIRRVVAAEGLEQGPRWEQYWFMCEALQVLCRDEA